MDQCIFSLLYLFTMYLRLHIFNNLIIDVFIVRKSVQSVDKRTGSGLRSIPYMLSNTGRPYDLVNIPVECPNLSNSCQV